jgi:hypothetical protein
MNGANIDIFVASIWQNKHLTEKVRENYISQFKGTADEGARLRGAFVRKSGLLYPVFDKEIHIVPYNDEFIRKGYPVIRAIDPHPQIPIHIAWGAIYPSGEFNIVAELICPENAKIDRCAEMILAKESKMNVTMGVIDTIANTREPTSGMTTRQQFANCGVYTRNARKQFEPGYALVMKALQGVDVISHETGERSVFQKFHIFKDCTETIYEFGHCTWEKAGSGEKDPPEKQKKYRNHMLDLVRYILMEVPRVFDKDTTKAPKAYFGGSSGRW